MKVQKDPKLLILGRTSERIAFEKNEVKKWEFAGVEAAEQRSGRLARLLANAVVTKKEVLQSLSGDLGLTERKKYRKRT